MEPDLYGVYALGAPQKCLCVRGEALDQAWHAGSKSTELNGSAPI